MALSLSLGEPRSFRFGPVFLLDFNPLQPNPAKTQKLDPNDVDGNIDGTRSRHMRTQSLAGARNSRGVD